MNESGKKAEVLGFIEKFILHQGTEHGENEVLRKQFVAGYCLHFAYILSAVFKRGKVCWAAPYGHHVWVDEDGTAYDAMGEYIGEVRHLIPVEYLGDCLYDFLRIPGRNHNTSEEEIEAIIREYEKDNKNQTEEST